MFECQDAVRFGEVDKTRRFMTGFVLNVEEAGWEGFKAVYIEGWYVSF